MSSMQQRVVRRCSSLRVRTLSDGEEYFNEFRVAADAPVQLGSFGRVLPASVALGRQLHALKFFSRSRLSRKRMLGSDDSGGGLEQLRNEVDVLSYLNESCTTSHPNIMKLFEVIDDPGRDDIVLVLEWAAGGVLMHWMPSEKRFCRTDPQHQPCQTGFRLSECKTLFRQIATTVQHLHSVGIAHRDLKPDNVLLRSKHSANLQVVLGDYGVAHRFDPLEPDSALVCDTVGAPAFLAPESLSGDDYDVRPADVWQLGLLLYAMLFESLPFYNENMNECFRRIEEDDISLPVFEGAQEKLGPDVQNLIYRLLEKDPQNRITLSEVMAHEWILS